MYRTHFLRAALHALNMTVLGPREGGGTEAGRGPAGAGGGGRGGKRRKGKKPKRRRRRKIPVNVQVRREGE